MGPVRLDCESLLPRKFPASAAFQQLLQDRGIRGVDFLAMAESFQIRRHGFGRPVAIRRIFGDRFQDDPFEGFGDFGDDLSRGDRFLMTDRIDPLGSFAKVK